MESTLQIVLKFVLLEEKNTKKSFGLLEFALGPPLGLSIVCHVGLHVEFSSMRSCLGL